ncbi:MAG: hypothetical protein QUV02_10700 [Maricaulis sp.]|nr:hypothetical protein [Maricaulis sp.]MDM7984911.1 hypothetical protein [Maricaulis sp.]
MARIEDIEIYGGRIVHDIGVVFAGKDVPGPAHIGGQLIDLVKAPVDHIPDNTLFPQIAYQKIIRLRLGMFMKFQIHATDPEAFILQSLDQMSADESTCATH